MSLLWRRRFTGDGIDASLMMKADTGLAFKCDRCPCEGGYSIATVCPCQSCGPAMPHFIGTVQYDGATPITCDYGYETYDLKLMELTYAAPPDTGFETGTAWEFGEFQKFYAIKGSSVLWGIRHQSAAAPEHAGEILVEVFIDGASVLEWNGGSYTPGEQMWVGGGVEGASVNIDALTIDYSFDEEGEHTVDVRVSFVGANGEPATGYTNRATVYVNAVETPVEIGDLFIVPAALADDLTGCVIRGKINGEAIQFFINVLKGPFDTMDDAEYVLATFDGIMAAFAATCACNVGCDGDFFNIYRVDATSPWECHDPGGVDDGSAGINCPTDWVEYDITAIGTATVMRIYDGDDNLQGSISSTGSGLLPPCWYALSFATHAAPYVAGEINLEGGFTGVYNEVCCLEDSGSPYYEAAWEYDSETHEGVPNNSADVEDYKESLLA